MLCKRTVTRLFGLKPVDYGRLQNYRSRQRRDIDVYVAAGEIRKICGCYIYNLFNYIYSKAEAKVDMNTLIIYIIISNDLLKPSTVISEQPPATRLIAAFIIAQVTFIIIIINIRIRTSLHTCSHTHNFVLKNQIIDSGGALTINTEQETDAKWQTDQLHKLGITGKGVTIAFLDSGINSDHVAFANRILAVKDLTCCGTDDFIGDMDSGHGTMVASVACGASFVTCGPNGDLIMILAGVAPSAKIVMYKITDYRGKAHTNMITRGLKQCLRDKERYGIDIVLLPYGSKLHDVNHGQIMQKLLNKNVLIVTASGNYGSSIDVSYPARLGYSICVGAHDEYGNITPNTCVGSALDFRTRL